MDPQDWVVLATIDRSRGRIGEVLATSLTGGPDSFLNRSILLRHHNQPPRPVIIEHAWLHDGRLVLKLAGVDSINDAEALRGADLVVRATDRLPLGDGEFYLSDLVGCVVFDRRTGRQAGVVTGWQEAPASTLLTVDCGDGRQALIPFVRAICVHIDPAARRIEADLPGGLLDL